MFDHFESDDKFDRFMSQKTGLKFGETQDESFVYEVEAEKQYVERLKNQREKIENLYSKYDVLLKDLKGKEIQLKEKDKAISTLETKCKALSSTTQENHHVKQQNKDIKTENHTLQRAISELEQSYSFLHGQFKTKEAVNSQKYEEMEVLNSQLMSKLRQLNKKYQQKEEQFGQKIKDMFLKHEQLKVQLRKEKQGHLEQQEVMKTVFLQKDQEIRLLKTENQCLKDRIIQLQSHINQLSYEVQEKIEHLQKEKKFQVRTLKGQIDALRQNNMILEKRCQKFKEETQIKQLSLGEMTMAIQQQEKQSNETISILKHQYAQEKGLLKEQLIQYENHVAKLERKIADCVRKEQCLYGKIKKYEVCLDAKRNLRQIEKEQLERINLLLNLP